MFCESGKVLRGEILRPSICAYARSNECTPDLLRALANLERVAQHFAARQESLPHLHEPKLPSGAHGSQQVLAILPVLALQGEVQARQRECMRLNSDHDDVIRIQVI